jgi:eukaryotic-like serine/threonine-protein kinase
MNSDEWRKVEQVFYAALELKEGQLDDFLAQACGDNESLRKEVESLLEAHKQSPNFIEHPIIKEAVKNLNDKQKAPIPGQTLGHYRLLELLGEGGMGQVYLAQDLVLPRKVALKLLPPLFMTDPERVRRLEREARSASALNHPNILTIYEIGEIDSTHYIATEYIDGLTLRQRMAERPPSTGDALDISIDIASALAAAQAAGIVHRDIKPENIMVRRDGIVKVVDFGLAKLHTQAATAPQPGSASGEEISSERMGTIKYMSPEQARGKSVDARSDIWSLGVVLYEMLMRRTPFDGGTDNDILMAIVHEQPLPMAAHVPAELQHIINKALSKRREERYKRTEDLLADLKRVKGASTQKLSWFLKAGVAAAILVLALIAGAIWTRDSKPSPSPLKIDLITRLTTSGNIVTATVSPDGNYLAYVVNNGSEQTLRTKKTDRIRDDDRELLASDILEYVGLSFSPDGKYIYYVVRENESTKGSLYRIAATGGTPTNLPVGDIESAVTFSPDGKFMAFVSRDSNGDQTLNLSSADGTDSRKLATRTYPNFLMHPAWSPDGEKIACVTGSYNDGFFMTAVQVRVQDGVESPLTTERWWSIRRLAWLNDGKGLFLVAMDQASGTPAHIAHITYPGGEVQKITTDLNDYRELSVIPTRNSLIAVQSIQTSDFWVASRSEDLPAMPITHTKYDQISGMAWTPDKKIVHALRRAGENWSIWSIKADGSDRVQLTKAEGNDLYPTVSPDGRYVVFTSTRSGATNIWRMDSDGSNLLQLTNGRSEWWPSISLDGRWVIYTSFARNRPTLWKIPIDGGSPVQLTQHFSILPVVSPTGNLVACYFWDGDSQFELKMAVVKIEDGQLIETFASPSAQFQTLNWLSHGQSLAYIQDRDGKSNIWAQPIAGGPPQQVTKFTTQHIFDFAVSPDGQNIAMARGSVTNDILLIDFR